MNHLEIEDQERREAAAKRNAVKLGPAVDETAVDWSQAPEWANYWAMDEVGFAYWYEHRPKISSRHGAWGVSERHGKAPNFGGAAIDWQDSLVARPAAIKDCFTTADTVDHPAHYTQGGIECIEVLEQLAADGHDFRILNAIKYLWRYRHKGGDESLRKSLWYIERLLGDS